MTFEVDVGGRLRTVSIERAGAGSDLYRITVDGRPHDVHVRRVGDFALSLLVEGGPVPRSSEVVVVPAAGTGEVLVTTGGRTVSATVNGRRTGRSAGEAGVHAHGEQRVIAPMPGRVVRVLVQSGDEVTAGQGVVVVEAMKMENELRSPKAGRVKDVQVSTGASVEAGRVLIVIE